jgi:hypothetical protein
VRVENSIETDLKIEHLTPPHSDPESKNAFCRGRKVPIESVNHNSTPGPECREKNQFLLGGGVKFGFL